MIGADNVTPMPAEDDRDGKHSLAVILMLAGSAVMFFALLLAYALLRAKAPAWPPPGSPSIPLGIPLVGTVVLAASSVSLQRGLASVRAAKPQGLRRGLIATLVLGGIFLALQAASWRELVASGVSSRGTYGGTFFMVTGFHGAHVIAALALLAWLLPKALRGGYHARAYAPVKLTTWFWHFLGGTWLVILVALYLV